MRILVCGGRDFNDYKLVKAILSKYDDETILIHGGQSGADTLSDKYGKRRGWPIFSFAVTDEMWKKQGRAAGPIRNRRMVVEGRPDEVIAFPGDSGTENMISQVEHPQGRLKDLVKGIKVMRVRRDKKGKIKVKRS